MDQKKEPEKVGEILARMIIRESQRTDYEQAAEAHLSWLRNNRIMERASRERLELKENLAEYRQLVERYGK